MIFSSMFFLFFWKNTPDTINNIPNIVKAKGKNDESLKNCHDNLLKNSISPIVPNTINTFLLINNENNIRRILTTPSFISLYIFML